MSHVFSDELRDQVREIVAEVLEVDAADITDDSSFFDDFDADSLLVIEMFARFERELGIKIPQEEISELDSLPAACEVVAKHSAAEIVHA
ncbi:acyl carrier protein [Amycolatopsis anabasis]|uniref:acyl carrier protein n=1 Tax=Amycolatopsis anabasis TaxID=1840409 RepID=UPI00131ECC7C|nr:acyl carrier protein [Amycolatopsis anabasis]